MIFLFPDMIVISPELSQDIALPIYVLFVWSASVIHTSQNIISHSTISHSPLLVFALLTMGWKLIQAYLVKTGGSLFCFLD